MKGKQDEAKVHPKDSATFASRVLLWWIFRLLWQGSSTPLQVDDLYPTRQEDDAKRLTQRLQIKWTDEKSRAKKFGRKPALWKALSRFFTWKDYSFLVSIGGVFLIAENVVWFCTIKLLHIVGMRLYEGLPIEHCTVYVCGIAFGQMIKVISANHLHLHGAVMGIRASAAVVGLMYNKILSVSKASVPAGHVMELVSDDSQRLVTSGEWFIQDMTCRILSCLCAFFWLFYFVGWQIAPGSLLLLSLGIYRFLIVSVDYKLRTGSSRLADQRLGSIREMLTGIHSVKMNCLEEIYEKKIRQIRWKEISNKAKRWIILASFYPFQSSGQQLATFLTVILLVFTESTMISYQKVFAIMVLISEVCIVFTISLPTATRLAIDVYKSLQRIQNFLESDDHVKKIRENDSQSRGHFSQKTKLTETSQLNETTQLIGCETWYDDILELSLKEVEPRDTKIIPSKPYVRLRDVTCKLPSLHTSGVEPLINIAPLLNYVTLDITEPGLVIITGPVGSGKSSLLASVLDGELLVTNGIVEHSGELAYVSATPWVFSGTIRENILFGLSFDEQWYVKTLKACQLEVDLNDFPQRDLSRLGEHGAMVVSGGQRARIALARAVYSKADIYLLDDPFSSLDAKVAENVFMYCLRGLLADRIVLLTTNTSRYLSEADYIVKLERGVVIKQGTFKAMKDEDIEVISARQPRYQKTTEGYSMEDLTEIQEDREEREPMAEILHEEKEHREVGMIPFKVYKEYFLYGAPTFALLLITVMYICGHVLVVVVDLQVSRFPFLTKEEEQSRDVLIIYFLLLSVSILLVIFATFCLLLVPINAAFALHNAMITSVIKAPLSFHSTNPIGRIMNRFSQDINNLDELLPNYFTIVSLLLPPAIATVVLASVTKIFLIPFGLITLFLFFFISKFFFNSAIEMRRLMALARSPLYSHFSDTMEGAPTVRVYKKQKQFKDKLYNSINVHNQALFAYYTAVRWFANTLDIISVVFSIIIIAMVVYSAELYSNEAITTIAIFYAVNTVQTFPLTIRLFAEIQSEMTSVQRILAYTKISPEKGRDVTGEAPDEWPHAGSIQFKNVSLRHYEDGPKVLRDLTFQVNASEKIGVAGRTGAGKSSLVAALMRLAEIDGEIIVDNINIMKLNVVSARRNISIISQSPVLISKSIRVNLDPFRLSTDCEIWEALDKMQLKPVISSLPQQLESVIVSSSSGFSVGEKQLFHLARVLLRKSKIIVFDEATGKVDEKTDEIIQRIIRSVFKDCTVITIAHRLSTILDCDRIMVLDRGEIVEFDKPELLLEREDGVLKQLYKVSSGY